MVNNGNNVLPKTHSPALSEWLTISALLDFSYRRTQLFKPDHNTTFLQWDGRFELWAPPYRTHFSWGLYLRLAGVMSNHCEAFENAWLSAPGIGIQVYLFSFGEFRKPNSTIGKILGPLRLFTEYNRQDYWGKENEWRPDEQVRAGIDFYRGINVNKGTQLWWAEISSELIWKTANEFDGNYDSFISGSALRVGARVPNSAQLSLFTPYLLMENLLAENVDYFWENRLLLGAGIRFTPDLRDWPNELDSISRFVIFAEYLHVAVYYRDTPTDETPDFDIRMGVSFSVGDFWK